MSIVGSWVDCDPRVNTVELLVGRDHERGNRNTDGISLQETLIEVLDQESECTSSSLDSEFFTDCKKIFEIRAGAVVDL